MTQKEALLGLATTHELLEELHCRFDVSSIAGEVGARIARKRIETLQDLTPTALLDYRTVGSL